MDWAKFHRPYGKGECQQSIAIYKFFQKPYAPIIKLPSDLPVNDVFCKVPLSDLPVVQYTGILQINKMRVISIYSVLF